MNTLNPPPLTGAGRMRGPAPDVASRGLPRSFVIGSIVLHVLMFLFAVGVPRLLSSGPSGNKVYVVDLVSLPGGPQQATPAPPAAAPPTPEPPKPAPPKAPEVKKPEVKKEPPKKPAPKPIVLPDKDALAKKTTKTPEKPPEKKPAEPEPKPAEPDEKESADESGGAEETAAPAPPTQTASTAPGNPAGPPGAGPGAGTGAGGGTGSGSGSGDELNFYYALLKRRIEAAWKRPVSTSREVRTAAVYIELSPTGRLLKLELKTPSGYAPFDRSIIQAVRDAEPFPPFPLALKMDRLTPILEFELTPLDAAP